MSRIKTTITKTTVDGAASAASATASARGPWERAPAPSTGRPKACAITAQGIGAEKLQLASPPPASRESTSPPATKSVTCVCSPISHFQ